jgi:hypothetical protein
LAASGNLTRGEKLARAGRDEDRQRGEQPRGRHAFPAAPGPLKLSPRGAPIAAGGNLTLGGRSLMHGAGCRLLIPVALRCREAEGATLSSN